LSAFVAALLSVVRGGAAIDPRLSAVVGGRPTVVGGRPAARATQLRPIVGERVADRSTQIAAGRLAVAHLRGPVTIVCAPVRFIPVVRPHPRNGEPQSASCRPPEVATVGVQSRRGG
jgi:hypothetical protein